MEVIGGSKLLHDAVIDQFRFYAERNRLEIIIWKNQDNHSIYWIKLMLSGIQNKKEIQNTQTVINTILTQEKREGLGFRIDEFKCNKQPNSNSKSTYIVLLAIDHLAPLSIECSKCALHDIGSELFTAKP